MVDDATHYYHLKCHFLLKPFLADIFILNKVESACASFLTLPSGFRPPILSNLFLSTSRWGNVSVSWCYSGDEFNKLAHFAQGVLLGPRQNNIFRQDRNTKNHCQRHNGPRQWVLKSAPATLSTKLASSIEQVSSTTRVTSFKFDKKTRDGVADKAR